MTIPSYVKPELLSIRDHPDLNERWVHERIAEDPSLLGLGDLVLRDRERPQPHAGRLDVLLQDPEAERRFEVEIQLGKTDESHIIRTLEYWDIERKRYPQYEHTAVIVAEQITGRFLNVINLFNGAIPIVAIQMQALSFGDQVSLVFTTVLNEVRLGLVDEDEDVSETVDRGYWEKRSNKAMLEITDWVFGIIKEIDPALAPTYRNYYVGVSRNGTPNNFVVIKPKKDWVWIEPRMDRDPELETRLEATGFEVVDYRERWSIYRIRLDKTILDKSREAIREVLQSAYSQHFA